MTTSAGPWICPQCGHSNRAGSRFCSRCRTRNPAFAPPAARGAAAAPPAAPRASGTLTAPAGAGSPDVISAGRLLVSTVGAVPPDGLEQWLRLRYQLLPALRGLADQVNGLPLADWSTERGYVSDFLARAAQQLDPAKRYSISFLGRNGLGKSTLANALLGASYLPEAFREPVTAAVTRVRAWRDRPSPDALRAAGVDPGQAQVEVQYFDEAGFIAEVLQEYYRRLSTVPGVNLPMPATIDNNALNAVRSQRNRVRDNPEAAANLATLDELVEAFLRLRGNLPTVRWMTYEQARHAINEKEATGAERDLLRLTREVIYFVDDSGTLDPLLANSGIELLDLPGLEAEVGYHEQTTMRALNEADAVVVVLQARRPSEKNTLAALAELARRKGWSPDYQAKFGSKVFIALNRADEIDLQPETINEYFGNNRVGLEQIIHQMADPVLPGYWDQHQGVDRAPFYLVSGYAALFAQQQARRLRGDPLVVRAPVLFPDLKERGELIYQAYQTISQQVPYRPKPQRAWDLDWLFAVSGVPELKGAISTFVRTRRFASSLEQADQGLQDARTRMRAALVRFINSRGVRSDQYDRYRQMGTDIQVAWERIDRSAVTLRQSFTEAILGTQREFPNRPDPAKGDRLTLALDNRIQAIKTKLANSLTANESNLRQAADGGGAPHPVRNLEDLISATPDLVNQASILQADRAAQLVLDLRQELDAQFASAAPELASILSDGFEAQLGTVQFAAKLRHLTFEQPDLWKRASDTYRQLLAGLREHYVDIVRTVLLRELVDPANSVEDERSTLLQALAAAQQPAPAPTNNKPPRRGILGAIEGALDQQPDRPAPAPSGPPPAFTQTYSLSLMVIETIQVELRRTRDIAASTARARALVQQAFGMLSERMKAVAEPLKRLYWLELSRLQDNGSHQSSIQDLVEDIASEAKKRVVSDPALRARILAEPDPDEPLRRAIALLDRLDATTSAPLRPDLRVAADQIAASPEMVGQR